jgi:hypothetical protein
MPRVALLILALASGCAQIFGLESPTQDNGVGPSDARLDTNQGGGGDAPSDSPSLCTGGDEDSDGKLDSCDACPTVADNGADDDGDGLPDDCDPNIVSTGDKILQAWLFSSSSEISTLFGSGATWSSSDHGIAMLAAGGNLKTDVNEGTRIEVRVAGLGSPTAMGYLKVSVPNGLSCNVRSAACSGDLTTSMCLENNIAATTLGVGAPPSTLTDVYVTKENSVVRCGMISTQGFTSLPIDTTIGNGVYLISTTGLTTSVRSIVIYGAK